MSQGVSQHPIAEGKVEARLHHVPLFARRERPPFDCPVEQLVLEVAVYMPNLCPHEEDTLEEHMQK